MSRHTIKLQDRITMAFYYLRGKKGILLMDCPSCHGIAFDVVDVLEETPLNYNAIYKCRSCGVEIEETQHLIDEVNVGNLVRFQNKFYKA